MLADVIKQKRLEELRLAQDIKKENNVPIDADIVIYYEYLHQIGGIETWLYEISKQYEYVLVYGRTDKDQLERLQNKGIKTYKYYGQDIKCNKLIYTTMERIKANAKETIQFLHGDYMLCKDDLDLSGIDRFIAVSKFARDRFKEKTGIDAEVMYNPIQIEKPKKILRLISATRLTKEKGKERIFFMIEKLKEKNIPFIWQIFTDSDIESEYEEVIIRKPTLDIRNYIADSTYLVQLSSSEANPYSVMEANMLGVPCITTDLEPFKEQEIVGYKVKLDMSDLDVEKIYKEIPKVEYKPKQSKEKWEELMKKKVYRERYYGKQEEITKEEKKEIRKETKEKRKAKKEAK